MKLNREQTKRFNHLYNEVMEWGEGDNCNGLFREFGDQLENLATCVEDGHIQILESNSACGYHDYWMSIPINKKAKSNLKKVVEHLIDGDFHDLSSLDI